MRFFGVLDLSRLGEGLRRLFHRAARRQSRAIERLASLVRDRRAALDEWPPDAISMRAKQVRLSAMPDNLSEEQLVECLALACEAARRTVGLNPHETQVLASIWLQRGHIVQMATGEGKTLAAALAASIGGLTGHSVHVVTANDYLAQRDASWMLGLYELLALRVGCRQSGQAYDQRRRAHACDIVYGTPAELAFDFLMDSMRMESDGAVCRAFDVAIVDEADHILLDEALNPLVITADVVADEAACRSGAEFVASLGSEHVDIDRARSTVALSEAGVQLAETLFATRGLIKGTSLFDRPNLPTVNRIWQALRARHLMTRDQDYILSEGSVAVLDAKTGRPTRGRFPDGLQQAIEAKEGLSLTPEQRPIAALNMRAFGRLYAKLSGMTATASADTLEFATVYGVKVVTIPPAVPCMRIDHEDRIYTTEAERRAAIITLIEERHARGQPILVGTTTIAKSEMLSSLLAARGLPCQVLHAHFIAQEANIVAEAGRSGAITIATNMAGRGTDIVLGGMPKQAIDGWQWHSTERAEVMAAGGLLVIGSERQRYRRFDDQLRGRAARRGDPGESVFFASLEDELMRPVRSGGLDALAQQSTREAGGRLLNPALSRFREALQAKNQVADAAMRQAVRRYDEILDRQRQAFQRLRDSILVPREPEPTDIKRAASAALDFSGFDTAIAGRLAGRSKSETLAACRRLVELLDASWQEHLLALDEVRSSVGWRAIVGRDPLVEFATEAFAGFDAALERSRSAFRAVLESNI